METDETREAYLKIHKLKGKQDKESAWIKSWFRNQLKEEREADRYEKYRSFVILFAANAVGASIRSILYLFTDLQLNDKMLQNLSYLILAFCLIILVVIKKKAT